MASSATVKTRGLSPASKNSPGVTAPLARFLPTGPADRFAGDLDRREANHRALLRRIEGSMIPGVDYGKVWLPVENRWSKPFLRKPGAEKICALLGLRARFPDLGHYERAAHSGAVIRQVVLRCRLETLSGFVAAEGTGARSLWQDYGDLNRSLQMAVASAQIDATLRVAGISGVFGRGVDAAAPVGAPPASDPLPPRRDGFPVQGPGPITAKQAALILRMVRSRFFSFEEREAARIFCENPGTTKERASRFISRLKVLIGERGEACKRAARKPAPQEPPVEDVSGLSGSRLRALRAKGGIVCWKCKAWRFVGSGDGARAAGWGTYVYRKRSFWACPGCLESAADGAGEVSISAKEYHTLRLRGKVVCGGCKSKWFRVPDREGAYVGGSVDEASGGEAARRAGWILWNDGERQVHLCPECSGKPEYDD